MPTTAGGTFVPPAKGSRVRNRTPAKGSGPPARLYTDRRRKQITTIDAAWKVAEAELPTGWVIIEICFMPKGSYPASYYASAGDPHDPAGAQAEGSGESPIAALLSLARATYVIAHRVGRPRVERLPKLRRESHGSDTYRSPDITLPSSMSFSGEF